MRPETSPEDIEGMVASEAIVTTHGGMTSRCCCSKRNGQMLCDRMFECRDRYSEQNSILS